MRNGLFFHGRGNVTNYSLHYVFYLDLGQIDRRTIIVIIIIENGTTKNVYNLGIWTLILHLVNGTCCKLRTKNQYQYS